MGWSSGGRLMGQIIGELKEASPEIRAQVYPILIRAFSNMDCDVLYEEMGVDPVYDQAVRDAGLADQDE